METCDISVLQLIILLFLGDMIGVKSSYSPTVSFYLDLYPKGEYWVQFPRKRESECIYEIQKDVTTCMGDYDYTTVSSTWKSKPEDVHYIKVNCRVQDYFFINRYVCFCSNADLSTSSSETTFQVCQLRELPNGVFEHLSSLEVLDLSGNYIIEIHPLTLQGLVNLTYLSISGNPISSVPRGVLCGLPELRFVHLSSTGLLSIPDLYSTCNQGESVPVEYLFMSSGVLKRIQPGVFSNMTSLIWLDLSSNKLTDIPDQAFNGASSLRVLNLSHNELTYPLPDICRSLQLLEVFKLNSCSFSAWDHNRFKTCTNLEDLDLSENQITEVEGDFSSTAHLTRLNLSRNRLQKIDPGFSLGVVSKVITLDLSQNLLQEIYPSFLDGSMNLTHLNLSDNFLSEKTLNLTVLLKNSEELQQIDISKNNISVLPANFFSDLPNLEVLEMSENEITEIHPDCFSSMTGPKSLSLVGNHIQAIYNNTFSKLTNLKYLDLSMNEISLVDIDALPQNLIEVKFNDNKLDDIPAAFRVQNFTALVRLHLPRNKLTSLDRNCFLGFSSLKFLDLSHNEIAYIDSDTFLELGLLEELQLEGNRLLLARVEHSKPFRGVVNLRQLNLAYNRISDYAALFKSIKIYLLKLKSLNMTGNPLGEINQAQTSTLDMELQTLILDRCNLSYVDAQAFYGLAKLERVMLRENRLKNFPPFFVNGSVEFDLSDNPVECSCHMKWLKKTFWQEYGTQIIVALYYIHTCRNPVLDQIVLIRDIPEGDFLCETKLSCPEDCTCLVSSEGFLPDVVKSETILYRLPRLLADVARRLYFSGNDFSACGDLQKIQPKDHYSTREFYLNSSRIRGLKEDFFSNHPLLKIINLENNKISDIPENCFFNLVLLEELYLGQNNLNILYSSTIKPLVNLKILDLRKNNFHFIHSAATNILSNLPAVKQIYLSGNQLYCSCSTVTFRRWLSTHVYLIPDWKLLTCPGSDLRLVHSLTQNYECKQLLKRVYINQGSKGMIIGLLLMAVILVVVATFLFRIRKTLKALLFVKFGFGFRRSTWDPDKMNDAYIIYNIYNREGDAANWVNQVLVPKLEQREKPYRVFLPDRDVTPGESIVDSSGQVIADSRRTIIVISESFITSQWCNRTFQIAYRHMLQNNNHKIIIVFHGKVKLADLDPVLKVFVMMGDYLKADSRFFWQRLFFELPDPKSSEDPVPENDVGVSETDVILQNAVASEGLGFLNNSHV